MNSLRIVLVVLLTAPGLALGEGCVHRDYGYGGVCVCNSTHCDSIPPLPKLEEQQYVIYTSNMDGLRFDLSDVRDYDMTNYTDGFNTLNLTGPFLQTVEGFGGAFTDAAGIHLSSLSEETREKLLEAYFSPSSGIGYTIGRVPIAGSDFSTRPYTYAENDTDPELTTFSLTEEDFLYKLPHIKRAIEISGGKLRIIAAAWTAPPWMKTNNNYTGVGKLKDEYYAAWSKYHIKFLEAYHENGVDIWLLSSGNEPLNGDIPLFPFNCMGWTPATQSQWITQHMGPALSQSQFNTTILAYDDQRFELPGWIKKEFSDEEVSKYVSGIGVHWYWDNRSPPIFLDMAHNLAPDKFLLATEACYTKAEDQEPVLLGSWERGEGYAHSIIEDMTTWVSGWVDWNLVLDHSGGPNWSNNLVDAAVIVNSTSDEFYKQPMFYAQGHFSRFIPVGSKRIGFNGGSIFIKNVAFLTPQDQIVVVFIHSSYTLDLPMSIAFPGMEKSINFRIWPRSIVTVVTNKPSSWKISASD